MKVKGFPLFKLSAYKGGIMCRAKQLETPIGKIAEHCQLSEKSSNGQVDGERY
jgi:hypothetical protein